MLKSLVLSLRSLVLPVVLSLVLSSCATTTLNPLPVPPKPQEEQDKRALEIFEQVVEVFSESDRPTAVPKAEALYLKIINDYPDAALGQECYWRLILIYLRDYTPPRFDKAEKYYSEFVRKYPQSPLRSEVDDSISNSFYSNGKWDKIIAFYTPVVRRYIESGKLDRPHDIFLYAEAKMNLGDLVEAEKGYKIVIALFPKSREGTLAAQRLDELVKKKSTTNKI